MPDYIDFQRSLSSELIALKDRVRFFIGDRHWGEDGHYKESVLMQLLRNYLPDTCRVGTGFVISGEQCSTQIDLIIYSASVTPFFRSGDFVIVEKSGVRGIVEVKTRLNKAQIADVVKKAHENGTLIGMPVFNGIFAFETDLDADTERLPSLAKHALRQYRGQVNNIAFGANIFMKHWPQNAPQRNASEHISFYHLPDLSFGYFISNLAEDVSGTVLTEDRNRFYYPIEGGNENFRLERLEITFH